MYLNLIQVAESFGVSEKVVEDWIRNEGLPHTPDRGRLLFDRVQVANWAAARGLAAQTGFLAPLISSFSTGIQLEPLLRFGGIFRDVPAAGVLDVFERVIRSLPGINPAIQQVLATRLRAKDGVNFAPIGSGFAVPHLASRVALGRETGAVALVLLRDPLALAQVPPDGAPVTRLFFFIAPSARAHLELLGRLCRALRHGPLRDALDRGGTDAEIFLALSAVDESASREGKA